MGKNTMMKRSIRLYCETTGNDKWACLLDELVGNVGIVFTNSDLNDVKAEIDKYKVRASKAWVQNKYAICGGCIYCTIDRHGMRIAAGPLQRLRALLHTGRCPCARGRCGARGRQAARRPHRHGSLSDLLLPGAQQWSAVV